jgi:hypothetical protein
MSAKGLTDKTVSDKKRLSRLLIWIAAGLVLVTLVVIVAVGVWLVPDVIRRRVERGLSGFCEGPVQVERTRVLLSGHVSLEGVQFYDTARRPWLRVEKVKAVLANWPGFKPTVDEITIDGLDLRLSVAGGKFVPLPVRLPEWSDESGKGPGFHKLTINQAAVTIVDAQKTETVYRNLTLSVVRTAGGDYQFTLNRTPGDNSEVLSGRGEVNPDSSKFDVSLRVKHRFTKAETALLFAALNMSAISAAGELAGDLSITGSLKKPSGWQPKGAFRLRDWVVDANDAVAWKSLSTGLEIGPSGVGLNNLNISDSNGVEWLSAAKTQLTMASWPGVKPVVTKIELDGPRLRTIAAGGRTFKIPAWLPERPASGSTVGSPSLQGLVVRDGTIAVQEPNGPKIVLDRLWLGADKQGDSYNIALSQRATDDSNAVSVNGIVNPTNLQVRLSLAADHVLKEQESALAFTSLGIPHYSAKGKIVADVAIVGDLNKPLGLRATGSVKCEQCTVFFKKAVLADNLSATGKLRDRRLDIDQFSAQMCKGKVSGYFYADANDGGALKFRGRVLAVNVNFPELDSVLTASKQKAKAGTFTASFKFNGQRNNGGTLNGEGLMFFDDADVSVLPAIPQIFAAAGLSHFEPLRMSDAEAEFTTGGPIVTIKSGHISNSYAAIEFEPGGTINLKTKQIDGYVVAAPLSQITGAIEGLPIIKIFARWKDKLIRLHVKGNWTEPPGKLITKESIKDLKDSTVGFLEDVVKGGGQFGRGMLDKIGGLFKSGENKSK